MIADTAARLDKMAPIGCRFTVPDWSKCANRTRLFLGAIFIWATFASSVLSQGFAGLGTEATDDFAVPERGTVFDFPADHGAHPAYRIEWWYLTATLTGPNGQDYGIQWTLFRSALAPDSRPGWTDPQIWMGHAGLTTPEAHFASERLSRGGVGTAGVAVEPFSAWIDEWELTTRDAGTEDALDALTVNASGPDFAYRLDLTAEGPLVFHGDAGYSVKSPEGQASYYYSQPHYRAEGTLTLPDGEIPVTGTAWLDREWSSQPLSETQDGWDWVSLQFDSGAKLMGFRLRDREGPEFTSATWIDADGSATPYPNGALTLTPVKRTRVSGRNIPTTWRAELPDRQLDVEVRAVNPLAWMDLDFASYWEGPVRLTGSHSGRGYLEMTGYPESE